MNKDAAIIKTNWEKITVIFEEVNVLEELIKIRMERDDETRESALKWAVEKYDEYK
jgi:hypothetical protein